MFRRFTASCTLRLRFQNVGFSLELRINRLTYFGLVSLSPFGNSKINFCKTAPPDEHLRILCSEVLRDPLEILVRNLVHLENSVIVFIPETSRVHLEWVLHNRPKVPPLHNEGAIWYEILGQPKSKPFPLPKPKRYLPPSLGLLCRKNHRHCWCQWQLSVPVITFMI